MSYEIYYRKCNINLSDNTIIPYHLAGSNNCTDMNGRRARDWESSGFFCNAPWTPRESRKISATEEEIREHIKNHIEETYMKKKQSTDKYDDDFKETYKSFPQFLEASAQYWFSMKVPGGTIKSMLSYFSAPTVTIQELFSACPSIELWRYIEGKMIFDHAQSESELIEKMNTWLRIIDTENHMDHVLKRINASKPATTPKIKKPQDFAFVILYGGSQVVSYRGSGFKFTQWGTGFKFTQWGTGKHFKTEALAQKVMEQLQKNTNARQGFEIKRIEGTFTF